MIDRLSRHIEPVDGLFVLMCSAFLMARLIWGLVT